MKITVLGSGSAYGAPMAVNTWCGSNPAEPKNHRLRPSILIEKNGKKIIVDAGPDFREQTCRAGLKDVDAIFLTHGHYDHIGGIPELPRAATMLGHPIEIYGSEETLAEVRSCYAYLFREHGEPEKKGLRWITLPDEGKFEACGLEFETFQVRHHRLHPSAFKIDNFAYITDWAVLPDEDYKYLQNLDLLMVECNNGMVHEENGHSDLPLILERMPKITAKHVALCHITCEVDYNDFVKHIPEGFTLCYDGISFEL